MNFIVITGKPYPQIAQATFVHQTVDLSNLATYPLKTPGQAYADLSSGKSYITPSYTGGANVKIQRISLGYYLGEIDQDYLMPVYVFQGDGNYCAYVSALSNVSITAISPSPTGQ